MNALAWIGRQRSRAIATLVVIAILTPPIGTLLRPFVTEAVIGLLCIAFLRIDLASFRSNLKRPWILFAAVFWTSVAIPALFALLSVVLDLEAAIADAYLGLMLQAVASPLMSAPAFALVLGLDATLVLMMLVISTALVPITAPLFALATGLELSLSPLELAMRLFAILGGSALIGLLARRLMGTKRIDRYRDEIDGINILIMFVFAAAMMGDLGIQFFKHPLVIIALTCLAFAIFALLITATTLVFLKAGIERAFTIGMTTGLRNMGLLLAGTGGIVPELTWLYFAVGQFPIYLAPLLLKPIVRRFVNP